MLLVRRVKPYVIENNKNKLSSLSALSVINLLVFYTSEFLLKAEFSMCSSNKIQALENSSNDCNIGRLVWNTRATPESVNTCEGKLLLFGYFPIQH